MDSIHLFNVHVSVAAIPCFVLTFVDAVDTLLIIVAVYQPQL